MASGENQKYVEDLQLESSTPDTRGLKATGKRSCSDSLRRTNIHCFP